MTEYPTRLNDSDLSNEEVIRYAVAFVAVAKQLLTRATFGVIDYEARDRLGKPQIENAEASND